MPWVKKEVVNKDIIISELKTKLTREIIISKATRNEEKPYGYLTDLIKDNYFVTLKQCDNIAHALLEHFSISV